MFAKKTRTWTLPMCLVVESSRLGGADAGAFAGIRGAAVPLP